MANRSSDLADSSSQKAQALGFFYAVWPLVLSVHFSDEKPDWYASIACAEYLFEVETEL